MSLISLMAFGIKRWWDFYVFYYQVFYISFFTFLAAVTFIYYLFFEGIWKRTPGKWASLSKVVTNKGTKPSFLQIVIRSAVRVIGVILIDSIFLSFLDKTLHDYLSKTEVVEA